MSPAQITIPFIGPELNNLILWRNVKHSALIFGGTSVSLLALQVALSLYSLPIIFTRAAIALVAVAAIWSMGASFLGKPGPAVYLPHVLTTGITNEDVNDIVTLTLPHLNSALKAAGTVLSGHDIFLSLKVVGSLWVAGFILSTLNILQLAFAVVWVAFTLPVAYEKNKTKVDDALAKALDQLKQLYGAASEKTKHAYAKLDETVFKKIPMAAKKPHSQ